MPIALAVWIRFIQKSFLAGDMSFETTLLLGVIGGRVTGVFGGALMAFPAFLHGEWITLPFNVLCGLAAGQLRSLAQDKEDIWSFSPFIDLSIYRWVRRNLPKPRFRLADHVLCDHRRPAFPAQELTRVSRIPSSAWRARTSGWRSRFTPPPSWPSAPS